MQPALPSRKDRRRRLFGSHCTSEVRSSDTAISPHGALGTCGVARRPKRPTGRHKYMSVIPSLSESARIVVDRMESDRCYAVQDIRALCPDAGIECIREIMHELWIQRRVERVGNLAWRRHRSAPPHAARPAASANREVRPEDLFDHSAFGELFE